MIVANPAAVARVSIAWARAAKTGFPNSGMSSPIAPLGSARPGAT